MGDMTENFSRWEFACRCECGLDDINPELVDTLQRMRNYIRDIYGIDKKMSIRSGCRCPQHNKKAGGKKHSAHLTFEAGDIKCYDSHTRFLYVEAALHCGVERIGIGKTFVHVDISESLPQTRIWLY